VPDILAIVSKAVFEKDARVAGKLVSPGQIWSVDRYNSNNKGLAPLKDGGRLFLVTVRPPDEHMWLVGVVDSPVLDGSAWVSSSMNTTPVTDISSLRGSIMFESGKGMSQDKGALGMSLQTPRALVASDVAQILALSGGTTPTAIAPTTAEPPPATGVAATLLAALEAKPKDESLREKTIRQLLAIGALAEARQALVGVAHLDAHDGRGLPCLCRRCWAASQDKCELGGVVFQREVVLKSGRALFFWAPVELATDARLHKSVRASLSRRLAHLAKSRKRQQLPQF